MSDTKENSVKEAQQLFNYYAVEVITYGATVARLQNLENAWVNLQTQSEIVANSAPKEPTDDQ